MSAAPAVHVGIVDHQPITLLGARAVLEDHPEIVVSATASDCEETKVMLGRSDLDLIVLDADHPACELEVLLRGERTVRILLASDRRLPPRIELRGSHLILGFVSKRLPAAHFRSLVYGAASGTRTDGVLGGDEAPAPSPLDGPTIGSPNLPTEVVGGDGAPPGR